MGGYCIGVFTLLRIFYTRLDNEHCPRGALYPCRAPEGGWADIQKQARSYNTRSTLESLSTI